MLKSGPSPASGLVKKPNTELTSSSLVAKTTGASLKAKVGSQDEDVEAIAALVASDDDLDELEEKEDKVGGAKEDGEPKEEK